MITDDIDFLGSFGRRKFTMPAVDEAVMDEAAGSISSS